MITAADPLPFYPPGAIVPDGTQTAELRLEPLTTAHVAADYAAVIASRTMLRVWSGSDWPSDTFALADNLADLARHEREHEAREAFTYTVLTPDGATCLGCLYLVPNTVSILSPREGDALVRFWVSTPWAGRLDQSLLTTLRGWLPEAFAFQRLLFHANSRDSDQLRLLRQAGLLERAAGPIPGRGGLYVFFEDSRRTG